MPNVPFAFFGTPYVARDTLAALVAAGYRPQVVVTSPDAPRGRGLEMSPSETKVLAETERVPVCAPGKLDEAFLRELSEYGCQYAVVVAYGKLLPQAVIDAFPQGILNIHYSLLPKYRGAAPVEAALLAGDEVTGVTIQQMVRKMDAGDIIAQRTVSILEDDTTPTLRPRLIAEGAALLIETLPGYLSGSITPVPQDESHATYAGKITKEDGRLTLSDPALTNWLKYRAYLESPGTFFYARRGDKRMRVKVVRASYAKNIFTIERIVPESKSEQDFTLLATNGWEVE